MRTTLFDSYTTGAIALFLAIAIGSLLGRFRIKGFSFGVGGILISATFLGYIGVYVPKDFLDFGIALFLYVFAIQSGPVVLGGGNKDLNRLLLIVFSSVFVTFLVVMVFVYLGKNQVHSSLAIFAGALTNSAGFAALLDTYSADDVLLGFSVAYLVSQLFIAFFVDNLPRIKSLGIDLDKEEEDYIIESQKNHSPLVRKGFLVENHNSCDKTLKDIDFLAVTGCVVSRVLRDGREVNLGPDTTIMLKDKLEVIGTSKNLEHVETLIGPLTPIPANPSNGGNAKKVKWFNVRNAKMVSKTYDQLSPAIVYRANILEVRRGGVSFSVSPDFRFRYGDQLHISYQKKNQRELTELIEGKESGVDGNLFSIFWGIILGSLIGHISLELAGVNLKLGVFNGILITALILGRIGKTGPIIWSLPKSMAESMEKLGFYIFIAVIGIGLGNSILLNSQVIISTISPLMLVIILIPMIVVLALARFVFRFNWVKTLNLIIGVYSNSLAFMLFKRKLKTNQGPRIFAIIYPLSTVLIVVLLKIFVSLVR